jgi:hypothetical protein
MASTAFIHKTILIKFSGLLYEALQIKTWPLPTHAHLG